MATRIAAEFVLTGTGFNPDVITAMLGVEPTKTRRVGDAVQNTLLRSRVDLWEISTGYHQLDEERDIDIPHLVRRVFERLRDHTSQLIRARQELHLDATLGCVLYVEDDDRPWVHFDPDIIGWAAQVGAAIDIDQCHLPES